MVVYNDINTPNAVRKEFNEAYESTILEKLRLKTQVIPAKYLFRNKYKIRFSR